jgi:hypothetical protein
MTDWQMFGAGIFVGAFTAAFVLWLIVRDVWK